MFGLDSIWHWLVILLAIALVFGTSKLRNAGGDLGAAIRSFRKGLQGDDAADKAKLEADAARQDTAATDKNKSESER